MNGTMDRICAGVVAARGQVAVPPGFAGRVMAHVRERAEAALDGWFVSRVAMPLMAGGGAASLGFGLAWMWLWQAGALTEASFLLTGDLLAGF